MYHFIGHRSFSIGTPSDSRGEVFVLTLCDPSGRAPETWGSGNVHDENCARRLANTKIYQSDWPTPEQHWGQCLTPMLDNASDYIYSVCITSDTGLCPHRHQVNMTLSRRPIMVASPNIVRVCIAGSVGVTRVISPDFSAPLRRAPPSPETEPAPDRGI